MSAKRIEATRSGIATPATGDGSLAGVQPSYVSQEALEEKLLKLLRDVTLPDGAAVATDAEAARLRTPRTKGNSSEARAIDKSLKNWEGLRDQGEITPAEFESKASELRRRRDGLRDQRTPSIVRQLETLKSLVDHWDAMTTEERKSLVGFIFEEVRAGVDGIKTVLAAAGLAALDACGGGVPT